MQKNRSWVHKAPLSHLIFLTGENQHIYEHMEIKCGSCMKEKYCILVYWKSILDWYNNWFWHSCGIFNVGHKCEKV